MKTKTEQLMTFKHEDKDVGPAILWNGRRKAHKGLSSKDDQRLARKLGIGVDDACRLLVGDYRKATPAQVQAALDYRGIAKDYGWITVYEARRIAARLGVLLHED